jgi:hypothetical protein
LIVSAVAYENKTMHYGEEKIDLAFCDCFFLTRNASEDVKVEY